jgi:hypothetical protein
VIGAAAGGGGVARGEDLVEFAEAVLGGDDARLVASRAALRTALGEAGLVDAAGIVGFFNAIDRVADATGVPLDPERIAATAEFRAALGIDAFAEDRD